LGYPAYRLLSILPFYFSSSLYKVLLRSNGRWHGIKADKKEGQPFLFSGVMTTLLMTESEAKSILLVIGRWHMTDMKRKTRIVAN
jgi:hypothetical protein